MQSYIAFTFNLLFIYCIIHSGIHSQELDLDSPHDMPKEVMDTVNTIKEKVKDIQKPEDIPQVADWVENCKKIVGSRHWRAIRNTPNRIMDCISKYINYKKLQVEIDDSIKRGDLDLVFQKYCGRQEEILECVNVNVEIVQPCLSEQQTIDLNVTLEALQSAMDFTCFENGDRIALFMAEEGIPCLQNTSDSIKECIENSVPEVKEAEEDPNKIQLDKFLINDANCKKISEAHKCVTTITSECEDPTPSNILDSLITQALKVTPCAQTTTYALNASSGFYSNFCALLPHFLTLVLAGLTAAHILL
ncbi:27 kDa hemolymph glycoprotein [Armadillidium vulgare]|nr:27 kDa hemolymph glycoprotein [Armadillidium vulgare]